VLFSDSSLLISFPASIVAFGVNAPRSIAQMAQSQDVPIISSNIIYRVMETIREKVAELLPPIIEFKVAGEANVQASFNIELKGRKILKVAGCRVTNGTLEKNKSVRLIRNGAIIYDGEFFIPSLAFLLTLFAQDHLRLSVT
jgi:translation initiation factor IF-2